MIKRTVRGFTPKIAESAWCAENAAVIGNVEIGDKSTVWYNVTLRGDVNHIRVGAETNIQDGTVVHGTYQKFGTTIGDRVTIGHQVMLHGCEIGSRCLIGMGSVLMDGVVVGEQSIVGAGSLLTEGAKFPPRSLVLGRPAKVQRPLTEDEIRFLDKSADNYLMYATWYKE
jgi:carbonic anhydrase/acetyltransferase-like protein (isoleucine patch superfamily)